MTNQQGAPEALRLAEQYDHGDPAAHGNAWKVAVCNELRRLHAENEALRTAHVQNPAEIEHVAGDVSKNGAELNMGTQQPAPVPRELLDAIRLVGFTVVKTQSGYSLMRLGKVEAQSKQPNNMLIKRGEWDALSDSARRLLTDAAARAPADSVTAECGNCFEGNSDFDHVCKKCGGSGKAADSVLEDAARWQALSAFFEEYQIDAMKLYRDIDAYLAAARKQGANHD